jgi:MATE family multidrug resistance protein
MGLESFTFMGTRGVSAATAVRVGQAVGGGHSARRVGLLGIAAGAGLQSLGALAFAAFPRALVGVFTEDGAVLAIGADLLLVAAVFQLFDGMQGVAAGALRGAGDVRFPFVASAIAYWGLGLPLAIGLAFGAGGGARGLWWGMTFVLVVVAIVLTARFAVLSSKPIARIDPVG